MSSSSADHDVNYLKKSSKIKINVSGDWGWFSALHLRGRTSVTDWSTQAPPVHCQGDDDDLDNDFDDEGDFNHDDDDCDDDDTDDVPTVHHQGQVLFFPNTILFSSKKLLKEKTFLNT